MISTLLRIAALLIFAVPAFGQATAIEPCPATPSTSAPAGTLKIVSRSARSVIDSSLPNDPAVEKLIAPYSVKVRDLNTVIARLEGDLKKSGVGSGPLGNFVSDGMRARAKAKLGKPVVLAVMNSGGLRKNDIAAGALRATDIWELLPFENALVAIDLNGAQLLKLFQIVPRDAQSGARIHFKWNDQNRAEFISGKLIDENGKEQDVDPDQIYTIVTIDYLVQLGSGSYAILQEAKSVTPLDMTLRDAILDYVKAETMAGRPIRATSDDRFVQVGPGPKSPETPR